MTGIACPHCTFLNPPGRVKCGMCLRLLRKRDRTDNTVSSKKGKKASDEAENGSSRSATSSPAESAQKSEVSPSPSQRGKSRHESEGKLQEEDRDETGERRSEEATQSSDEEACEASGGLSSSPAAPPASAVPTLFVTASGKAVTVRRESLLRAAERMEGTSSASPSFFPPTPPAPASLPPSGARVATMFETANGKKVTVQRDSIEKAKAALASLDTADAELPRATTTHFEAVPGRAACVSEASLRHTQRKLDDAETASEAEGGPVSSTTTTTAPDDSVVPPEHRNEKRAAAPPASLHSSCRPSLTLGGLSAGRRCGFVPPQQRLVADVATARPPRTGLASAAADAVVRLQSTRLEPLRFPRELCRSSNPISPAPATAAIMSEEFCFTAEACGTTLAFLLGVQGREAVRVAQWHACLLKLGASAKHCTLEWCRHALLSAMFRMSCAARCSAASAAAFTATSVLLCLLQTYNTEMVEGVRPALRKMVEGDIPSASLAVLYLSSVRAERSTPHTRIVTLSDGIYHMRVTCDVPLSNLLREGVLRPSQKLAVCGAKSLLHGQCSPTECGAQVVLAINYNCVRAVSPQVPLGVCHGEPPPLPLSLVHPLGGLVPAIEGVVARVLPSFYMTQENESVAAADDGSRPARDRAVRAVRSSYAQLQASDRLLHETVDGECAAEARPLSRVTSLLIVKDGAEALVQQWETVEESSLLSDNDGEMALPLEGSWVTFYAVNPAKSRTAAAPFSHAKLFFSARKLHFVPSKKPLQYLRRVWETTVAKGTTVCVGDAADVCGLFMGHHKNEYGCFVLVLLQDSMYALLQIPLPSASRALSFPIPATEKTPLLLLNSTFLTTEDSVAGSDCCRLFANEYTVVRQRSTQSNLKEALERAASLRAAVEAAPQKYAARKAEIFRCLDEGEAATPEGTTAYSQRGAYLTMTAAPLDAVIADRGMSPTSTLTAADSLSSSGGGGLLSATSFSSREGRLPYYLRRGCDSGGGGGVGAPGGSRRLQGVVISPLATSSTSNRAAPQLPSLHAITPLKGTQTNVNGPCSRHYGNISDFMFVYDARLNRRPWHPLEDPLRGASTASLSPPSAGVRPCSEDFQYVQLCWSVSADSADDLTSKVETRRELCDMMEAVCPLQELCSLIADDRHIDVSLQRSEVVARWRKDGTETAWWRFFTESRLLALPGDLDDSNPSAYLWWLPNEWAEATKTIAAKLQTAFFFFSLRGDTLRHARLISDSCDVRQLPQD
ncbi:BRCA2 repeat-containing protein [Lotmaria passim]